MRAHAQAWCRAHFAVLQACVAWCCALSLHACACFSCFWLKPKAHGSGHCPCSGCIGSSDGNGDGVGSLAVGCSVVVGVGLLWRRRCRRQQQRSSELSIHTSLLVTPNAYPVGARPRPRRRAGRVTVVFGRRWRKKRRSGHVRRYCSSKRALRSWGLLREVLISRGQDGTCPGSRSS